MTANTNHKKNKTHRTNLPTIWRAHDCDDSLIGFLVTEPDNINHGIAWVSEPDYERTSREEALELAVRVRTDPAFAAQHRRILDLRHLCRPDSVLETPGILYGVWCRPIIDFTKSDDAADVPAVQPNPYCPIRFKAWATKLAMQTFSREQWREYGREIILGIQDPNNGGVNVPIVELNNQPSPLATMIAPPAHPSRRRASEPAMGVDEANRMLHIQLTREEMMQLSWLAMDGNYSSIYRAALESIRAYLENAPAAVKPFEASEPTG